MVLASLKKRDKDTAADKQQNPSHANNKGQHGPSRWILYVNKVRLFQIAGSVEGYNQPKLKGRKRTCRELCGNIIVFFTSAQILRSKVATRLL